MAGRGQLRLSPVVGRWSSPRSRRPEPSAKGGQAPAAHADFRACLDSVDLPRTVERRLP
jgi:hypothetical protein